MPAVDKLIEILGALDPDDRIAAAPVPGADRPGGSKGLRTAQETARGRGAEGPRGGTRSRWSGFPGRQNGIRWRWRKRERNTGREDACYGGKKTGRGRVLRGKERAGRPVLRGDENGPRPVLRG